jgi:hypothetical protein
LHIGNAVVPILQFASGLRHVSSVTTLLLPSAAQRRTLLEDPL